MEEQEKYLSTGQLMDFLEISRSRGTDSWPEGCRISWSRALTVPKEQVLGWLKEINGGTEGN